MLWWNSVMVETFKVQIIISKHFESYRDEIALESYDTIVFHL